MAGRRARDIGLLDALDALPRMAFEGTVWRAVRAGRDPLQGHPSAGRWDPGTFDVLYTSMEPDGAAAEIHFHVAPAGLSFDARVQAARDAVRTAKTLRFADLSALAPLLWASIARDTGRSSTTGPRPSAMSRIFSGSTA